MPDTAQTRARSYRLPVEDQDFLLRDEMRSIRFALEYSKAELSLRDWGIRSTIIIFGSAHIVSPEQAEAARAASKTEEERRIAERMIRQAVYYQSARDFGRIASERGGALPVCCSVRISNNSSMVPKPPGKMTRAFARIARCILRIAK